MKGLPSNRSEVLTLARERPRELISWLSQLDPSSNFGPSSFGLIQALEDAFPDETGRLEGPEVDIMARYLDRIYTVVSCRRSLSWELKDVGKPQYGRRKR
jgi:hypothetical protein